MEEINMTNNNQQTDIFSLFGLVDEHEEKQKQEAAERQAKLDELRKKAAEAKPATAAASTVKKEDDQFTPNEDTTIRYYGESIEITSYFSPEELAEGILVKKDGESVRKPLEAEMLRKRMEKDFPELVKQHTEIIFIKNKNIIVPTMRAKKKGGCMGVLSKDSTSLSLSKIPFSILQDFIAIAKLFGEMSLEIHGDIYFHHQEQRFLLDIPKQNVHRLWTEVTEDAFSVAERIQQHAVKVAEIHSHHTMPPTPSLQDDESERCPLMHYVIVGHIERFFPSIYVRQFISDESGHVRIQPEALFECPFQNLPDFDTAGIEVFNQ